MARTIHEHHCSWKALPSRLRGADRWGAAVASPFPPPAPPPAPRRGLSDLAAVALSMIATIGVLALVVALAAFVAGPAPERSAEADDEPRFETVGEAIGPSDTEPDAPVE